MKRAFIAIAVAAIIPLCSLLDGCSLPVRDVHDYCAIARPIILQPGEAKLLSKETDDQLRDHNCTWSLACNKKACKK